MFLQITQEILIVASQKSEDIALGEKRRNYIVQKCIQKDRLAVFYVYELPHQ